MSKILNLSLNQDCSCITLSTTTGYSIFSTSPFKLIYTSYCGGIKICEILYSSSLIVVVGAGIQPVLSPRRLQLYNTISQMAIIELNFSDTIVNILLNRNRLIVVLQDSIHIFDMLRAKLLHTLDIPNNPHGICCLSNEKRSYLAIPSSNIIGDIMIYDSMSLQTLTIIKAHNSVIKNLCFNRNGNMLATASSNGTVIRIFSIPDGKKLYTFRRGVSKVSIYSMAFNETSELLCVCSNASTIHIFDLTSPSEDDINQENLLTSPPVKAPSFSFSTFTTAFSNTSTYLTKMAMPTLKAATDSISSIYGMPDATDEVRSFAKIKLLFGDATLVCGFSNILHIVTSNGYYYAYSFYKNDFKLLGEYSLISQPSSEEKTQFYTNPNETPAYARANIKTPPENTSNLNEIKSSQPAIQQVYSDDLDENNDGNDHIPDLTKSLMFALAGSVMQPSSVDYYSDKKEELYQPVLKVDNISTSPKRDKKRLP